MSLSLLARRSRSMSTVNLSCRPYSIALDGKHQDCDIVIVGGGPAGLALASALGSSNVVRQALGITLIEAGDLYKVRDWVPSTGFSNRVSSITNASQNFLKEVGAWGHVEHERTMPMQEMQVWDGVSDARMTFSTSELGLASSSTGVSSQPQMARLTENYNLQRALLRRLEGISEVRLLDKTSVSSIVREDREGGRWPLVHLSNGDILRARLLVGADGFNSPVRKYAGINSYGWAYNTQAIVATLVHPPRSTFQGPNTTAFQRFLPTGPIAFLPLSHTVSSLVWSTHPRLASVLTKCDLAVLASMINAAFRLPEISVRHLHRYILECERNGSPLEHQSITTEIAWREKSHNIDRRSAYFSSEVPTSDKDVGIPPADADSLPPLVNGIQTGTVASFPLRYNHADAYIGEGAGSRTVLVGDAAHTVHPLAGQGLNMGLGDVQVLAECIHNAVSNGGDIGAYTVLQPYAQARYFENHKLMSAVDKLHKLYSTTFEPIVWARSVGLEVVNELDSVKAAIMLSAGADTRVEPARRAPGWNMAAATVENLAGGVQLAKTLGEGLKQLAGVGAQQMFKSLASRRD